MEQIKSELSGMRLSGMDGALQSLQESRKIHELSFTDGLRILLQAERDQRQSNRSTQVFPSQATKSSSSKTIWK